MRSLAIVLSIFLTANSLLAGAVSDRQKELRKIQDQITEKNREKNRTTKRARELEDEVTRISRELRSSRRALKELDERLRETEKRRMDAENRLWAARLDVKQWRRTLAEDLRLYYERRAAAETSRFVEMAWRRRLAQEKISAASTAVERHAELRASHDELASVKTEFESLKKTRESESVRTQEASREMTRLLQTVQGRRAVLGEEIRELRASARRFEELIQKLIRDEERAAAARLKEKPRPSSASSRSRKSAAAMPDFGKLPWPISGAVVSRFGKFKHPELDTVVVSNGVKIRPETPGQVRAVAGGEVLYAGEFMGYGLMALISHPDNLFTIYAHLGELKAKKGQKVSVGEVLGRSGEGADERAVYFELRLHCEAMDPLLWLK